LVHILFLQEGSTVEVSSNGSLRLADLKPKMRLDGKVAKISMAGALIDVGVEKPGLLHISQLRRGQVNRVEDVLQEGQELEVWVLRVDKSSERLELTLIPPVQVEWKDLQPGARFRGRVVRLEKFGAFVDIGADRPGLVHVSEMSSEYVRDPGEIVKPGDEVDVVILDVDRKKRQIRFSMKSTEAVSLAVEDEDDDAPMPTAMEIAFHQAMQERASEARAAQEASKPARERSTQEDILARTLRSRVRTSTSTPDQ
jgi:small subunit ribosomal protein S1